jgi:excisionase family DNA binding protein
VPDSPDPNYLEPLDTAVESSLFLGLSVRTVYKWAAEGRLPCYHLGSSMRFRRSELEAWLQEQRTLEAAQ